MTGIAECDDYIREYSACTSSLAPELRDLAKREIDAQRSAFARGAQGGDATRGVLADRCTSMHAGVKARCGPVQGPPPLH
jgi:hypothetical protein